MTTRFTIDGSKDLEERLERLCARVRRRVVGQIPRKELEAIVLGGGYGRGEGGVLKTAAGERPYNDLEFYVFVRGNRLWLERRYRKALENLGDDLSVDAGLHVEFKIDCIDRWKETPTSMFSYDLVSGHRVVQGSESIFAGCEHHLDASAIPLSEATRLLFNRCSGLLLAREMLQKTALASQEADFVARNLAKAQLSLGDALLTAFGQYHWSVRERNLRLANFETEETLPWLAEIRSHHSVGLDFKLHPRRISRAVPQFEAEHRHMTELSMQLWLWLEGRRLQEQFLSPSDYALSAADKCPETPRWRNYLLNVRTFGAKAAMDYSSWRYPRERLFNALSLLLWNADAATRPPMLGRLQKELQTDALDLGSLVGAFKRIWTRYG